MSGYLSKIRFTLEFEGDTVNVVAKQLHRNDALKLSRFAKYADAKDLPPPEELQTVIDVFGEILPRYVEEFTGLRDSDGSPVDIQAVSSNFYFTQLMALIGNHLLHGSTPRPTKRSSEA